MDGYPPSAGSVVAAREPAESVSFAGLTIRLEGFDDLPVKERTMQLVQTVDRLSVGELKDKMEAFFEIPRIFIEIQSGSWMCSGQRMDSDCPFQASRRNVLEVDRDNLVRLSVWENSARRWALDLEKTKQRASQAEGQLFSLKTKLEEERIRATDDSRRMRERLEQLGQEQDKNVDDNKDLVEQTNLLKMTLEATKDTAQSRIRVLESELLTAKSSQDNAVRELTEKHHRDVSELMKSHLNQIEVMKRVHQDNLDQRQLLIQNLEDRIEKLEQKIELTKSAKNAEIQNLLQQIHHLEQDLQSSQQRVSKYKSKPELPSVSMDQLLVDPAVTSSSAAASTSDSSSSASYAGSSASSADSASTLTPEEIGKLEKKIEKLSEKLEEREEELHAKQQLLRRVRFLVDQMNCIAEKKKK